MVKKRLGIDALFASTVVPAAVAEAGVQSFAIDEFVPSPYQPRRHFSDASLANLVASIEKSGVLQPIIARELTGVGRAAGPPRYEIVAGERRWRAARLAGLSEIPALVRALRDEEALQVALAENLQREDLNPVEETEGYLALLQLKLRNEPEFATFARAHDRDPYGDVVRLLFAMNNQRASERQPASEGRRVRAVSNNIVIKLAPLVETAFAAIGRTNWLTFVQHRLPLRRLPVDILEALREGRLEYTKARLLGRISAESLGCDERHALTVRARLLHRTVTESLSLSALRRAIEEETAQGREAQGREAASARRAGQLQDLARHTAARLRQLQAERLSADEQLLIQEKLDELCALIARIDQPEQRGKKAIPR